MQQLTANALPRFGDNYEPGYIGFVFRDDSFVSKGIVWFTRWDRSDMPPVSHALVVTGENSCVEALPAGVQRSNLKDYFDSPHTHIFFRKPIGYTPDMAKVVCDTAFSHVGDKYNYTLIGSDVFANSTIGHFINRWTNNWPNRAVSWLFNHKGREICSQLVAMCLVAWTGFRYLGCLRFPPRTITPQMLAGDDQVFVPMTPSVYPIK